MSIISRASNNVRTLPARQVEPSPYDGFWLNIGMIIKDEDGNEKFIRLPRGVAVSDLAPRKIYENMSPEFAAQVKLENQAIAEIQAACAGMQEGESLNTDALAVQLYRRNEEVDTSKIDRDAEPLGLFTKKAAE